jgi:diguanylate cyclase (GGDEF)-like protein
MASRFIVERFVFLLIAFIGVILLLHTLVVKIVQDIFLINYSTASCTSGVILMTLLYMIAKFNKGLEKQISNFLYFKGKHHYKVLLKEAITDGLTDLYDHKYLLLKLEEEMERSKRCAGPISLLMIDIDHFKGYNDTFGHPAGDKILADMANIFKRCSRKADTVARYGGEEFAIVLPETNKEEAGILAERLREKVGASQFEGNVNITVSIGLGFFDGKDTAFTKENFIKIADEALYRAKSKGRNRVEF